MDLGQSNTNNTLLVATNDSRAALLKYDPTNQRISGASNRCLARNNRNLVQFLPCSTGINQEWTITIDRQIRNVEDDQCLTVNAVNEATLQPCSFATLDISLRQDWAFHPQP